MDNYEKYIQDNQKLMEKAYKDALITAETRGRGSFIIGGNVLTIY